MNRRALALTLALLPICCLPASAQMTPDEALKTFTVPDGLQLELFASEPMFTNPTCIDVDHKGRVWVCESVNYRHKLRNTKPNRAEGDRIVVLEDTDADGKADKAHTFFQAPDLLAPLGIAVAPNADGKGQKVYVCHSPHIYLFDDADGDLKADGPPKILLTGFKGFDHDHGVHGIHFGPDGKLYFSVGDQGVDGLKDKNGKVWKSNSTDCRAGTIWRCDPDGSNLELLAHNFRNQYEPAVNSFGTIFVSDNDDDGNQQTRICYVMPGGNYGYHPRGKGESHWHEEQPGVVHKVLRTGFGSPTGLCWYEGSLLSSALGSRPSAIGQNPKEGDKPIADSRQPIAEGLLLHTDAGPREVRCFTVKSKGAGYELDKLNLVTSTDNWFRPSDVCVAPDGSIIISDWYDPGVGGHGMGDTTRGRIYRLTPKGHQGYKVPEIKLGTKEGILATIGSPCLSTRALAIDHLSKVPGNERRDVAELGFESTVDTLLARSLWLLYTSHSARRDDIFRLLENKLKLPQFAVEHVRLYADPDNRFYVLGGDRFEEYLRSEPVSAAREWLLTLRFATNDERQLDSVKRAFYTLAQKYDGQDHFYLAAIGIAVGTDPKRREVILADFEKHFPEWNDKVAKLVWELRPPQVIAKLDQKLADPKLTDVQKAQILDILAVADDHAGKALLKLLSTEGKRDVSPALQEQAVKNLVTLLPNKWASLKTSTDLKNAIDRLLTDPLTTPLGIDLIGAAERVEYVQTLQKLAGNAEGQAATRQAAVQMLGKFKSAEAAASLRRLLSSPAIRKDAIQALGAMQTPEALVPLRLICLDPPEADEDLRNEALAALASGRPGTIWLLEAHEQKHLPPTSLNEVGRLLRNSPFQDLRNRAMIAFPAPGKMDVKNLPAIAKLVGKKGTPEHGRELFAKSKDLGCVRCHSIRGVGGNIGPDLSMIGKKGSRENLFESILTPDKAIADQFIQMTVLDQNGLPTTGLVIEETKDHVILRDANGKDTKFLTKDIDQKRKSAKSIMPSDLLAYMTEQDLVDMVAYLETLKTPALTVNTWSILGPFDNGQNDEGLDKAHIKEPPHVEIGFFKFKGKYGEIGPRAVKPNAEGYVDLAAFFAPQNSQIVSYLFCEFESPADQDATLLLGADDGCKLWVNGTEVLSHKRHEAATPERDKVPVKLKKGKNHLWLKINNGDGPHGFYFSVVSEQELKVPAPNR